MAAAVSTLQRALTGLPVSVFLRIARLLIGLVLAAMLNRHVGPDGAGQLMIGLAWVAPLLCLAELGFNRITVRELARCPEDEAAILGTTFFTRLAAGGILFFAALAIASALPASVRPLIWIYALLLPTHASSELLLWLESKGQLATASWIQFRGFLVAAALMMGGLVFEAPPIFFAVTYVTETWAAIAILAWHHHRHGGSMRAWQWSASRSRQLLAESWPEMLAQLMMLMLFRLDTIMIGSLRGAAEAGIYSVAVRLSEVVYFVAPLLGSAFLPRLVELRNSDQKKYERRFSEYLGLNLALAIACGIGLTVMAPALVLVMGGQQFAASGGILAVHAWGVIAYYFGVSRTQYLAAEHRLSANLPAVLVGLIVNFGLNLWWIPRWGGLGAAWATVAAYTLAWLGMTCFKRELWPLLRWQVLGLLRLPSLAADSFKHGQTWWQWRRA